MLPLEDTTLAVTDTGGTGTPVVHLNGSFAGQRHWRPVIDDLGSGWRHISYDERARGKSKKSADYSFEACVRDLDAVLTARRVERPLLVGWSYGALLGVQWAARNPGRVAGVVGVDGPYPVGWTDEADLEKVRRLFRRFRWALPMAHLIGNAARMSAEQHAEHRGPPTPRRPRTGPRRCDRPGPVRGRLGGGFRKLRHRGGAGGR